LGGKKKDNDRIESEVKAFLQSGGKNAPQEYVDYVLMTELWRCTPLEFEKQEEKTIDLHTRIYNEKNRQEWKRQKREEQRASLKK